MPMSRETSPKRKRTDDSGETTEHVGVNADAGARRLYSCRIGMSAMRSTTDRTDDHDKRTTNEEVDNFLRRCDDRFAQGRLLQEKTSNRRLLNAITAAQITQTQAGRDLLTLTNKLHDWARHLDAQEHYLRQQEAKLTEQQRDLTMKLLNAAMEQMETNFNHCEESLGPDKAEQIEQLKYIIGTQETTIEVLISKLMIEKEARAAVEKKLKARENTGGDRVNSPTEDTDENEVDHYVPSTRSPTPSPVPSPAKASTAGEASTKRASGWTFSAPFLEFSTSPL